jgi:hypothetical protein
VLDGEGFATRMHQDLSVWVTLDDELLFHSPSIHEHQGLHVLTVTPSREGVLKFWADDGSAEHHDHREVPADQDRGPSSSQVPATPTGFVKQVVVTAGASAPQQLPKTDPWIDAFAKEADFLGALPHGAYPAWRLGMGDTLPFTALLTMQDQSGRLLLSAWLGPQEAEVTRPAHIGNNPIRALFAPHPASPQTFFTEERRSGVTTSGVPAPSHPFLPDAEVPDCAAVDGRLTLDPNSLVGDNAVAWQEWSDLRVHYLDHQRVEDPEPSLLRFTVTTWPLKRSADLVVVTDHPMGYVSMGGLQEGNHVILIEEDKGQGFRSVCMKMFHILPGPPEELAGHLEAVLDVDRSTVKVDLWSVGVDSGLLPHYEFDVHVVRLADDLPAQLVWRGKLHGHDGQVSFAMGDLLRGEYEMRVFPSPQDAATPPLSASGEGFVYPFEVEAVADDAGTHDQQPVPVPGFVVFLACLLSALWLRGRARRR